MPGSPTRPRAARAVGRAFRPPLRCDNGGIYGGKGGRHLSSLALASGGRKCQWSIISNLQTAASAGRPERRNTGQAKTAQLQSCHGKIGSSPKIPPKNHSSQKCNSVFLYKGDSSRQKSTSPHLREFHAWISWSEMNPFGGSPAP
jgi:hypothetical protein